MRLTRFTGPKDAEAPVVQPSPAHEALLEVLEDLLGHFAGESHPVISMVQAMKPSLTRDLTLVPASVVRREAAYFAERFVRVATAGAGEAMAAEAETEAEAREEGVGNDVV